MTDNNETSLEFEFQAAERLEAAGRLDEAAAIYQQLQRRFPEEAEVYRRFGRLSSHERDSERALVLLEKARDLAPDAPKVRIDLAVILVDLQRLKDAEAEVEQAITLDPNNGDYRVKRALLHLRHGEREAAAACCREALARAPGTNGAHQLLGSLCWQSGDLEAAAEFLLTARQAEPPAADPNGILAMTLFALGRPREIAGLTRCLSDSQLYIEVVEQAVYAWEAGKFEYCRQILERASSIHAQVADAERTLVFRPLYRILSAVLEFGAANSGLYEREAAAPLIVLGDNHTLSAGHLAVPFAGATYRLRSAFVNNLKAWHIAKPENNPARTACLAILDRLPAGTKVVFSLGELDCRYRDSFMGYLQANPDRDMAALIDSLVDGYLDRALAWSAERSLDASFMIPPAPNVKLRQIPSYDRPMFLEIVQRYNEKLAAAAATRGCRVVDLHAVTYDLKDSDKRKVYLDGNHVLPAAVLAAFEQLASAEA